MEYIVVRDDISRFHADAIVLPANQNLKEGNGTSTAIFEKAGRKELTAACKDALKKYKNIHLGATIPTLAFNLDAKFILHAITPSWIDGFHHEYELLSSAYYSALKTADLFDCKSIAFPLLASGNNGFNRKLAFEIAHETITSYESENKLETVYLVIYGARVTDYLRKQGIKIIENIDETYVLNKNERMPGKMDPILGYAQKLGGKLNDAAVKVIGEKLNDPTLYEEIIRRGMVIAGKVLKDALTEKEDETEKNI